MRSFLHDVRYAVRNLLKAPGFAAIAALTLAIGIGANTAIFSIIDSVLLRPLPFRSPEQLVRLNETEAAPGKYPFAGPDYVDWKAQNKTFQDMTMFGWAGAMNLNTESGPERVIGLPVEANFFALLGVGPKLGRTWLPGEDRPGKNEVAVLSYGLWQERFAGDRGIVGRSIQLNSKKYTVMGVMPAEFRYPWPNVGLWVPLAMDGKGLGERGGHWANAIGRMKPGVTAQAALADLKVIAARLEQTYPNSNDKIGAAVTPLRDDLVGDSSKSLTLLLSAVGLVLLIACANVANLLLSRAVARQKEMAVRSALGAGRGRLVRQLLTESLLLSAAGGVLGLFLAWGIIRIATTAKSFSLPQFRPVELNPEVLGFAFLLAMITGVLFGIVPALRTSRPDLHEELKGGAGSLVSQGRARRLTSNVLVVAEIALSLLMLSGAGLLLKDFVRVRSTDIGVQTEGVFTAAVQLPDTQYKKWNQRYSFWRTLLDKCAHIPGVQDAAISTHLPLEGGSNYYIKIRGRAGERSNRLVEYHAVTPDYFRALGIRLLEGRLFSETDLAAAAAVDARWEDYRDRNVRPRPEENDNIVTPVLINQRMAKFFWPKSSPLGQMFSNGGDHGPWRQVVGVVSDVRQWSLTTKPVPEAYDPFTANSRLFVVLRTSLPPAGITPQVRAALGQIDGTLPLFSVRTMSQVIGEKAQGHQFLSVLVGSFAGIAMLLAAIGIYGVLSYAVTQRTREIGIRMSLGATRSRVLGSIIGQGMLLAAIGFVLGIAGAVGAGKIMATMLHEVKPGDPAIIAATTVLLAAVALIACWLPARRAARLDPMRALHYE